ncbi:hypothetical protein scyTo_0022918, partial [Scyliorhinus torazame]|nr:hypothetical protein [Scyliorhinus torazame]
TSTSRLPHVQKYQVVRPQRLHAKQKRAGQGLYPSILQFTIPVEGKERVVHLEKNHGYLRTNGQRYLMEPLRDSASDEHALYKYEELRLPSKACGVVNTSEDNQEPRVEETFSNDREVIKPSPLSISQCVVC